jgi:hypothetical protein
MPVVIHLLALSLLAVLTVAPFWRVFIYGETLVDLATQANQLPWGATQTTGVAQHPYNRRDLTDTYVTRDYFVVASYQQGELPLWNPDVFAGHPFYADGVTKIFSPLLLFYCWWDIPQGYTLARLTELWLAGVFLYIFLINLRLSTSAALIGSTAFLLSDHALHHLTWLGWLGGLMWLPLMLMGADRALRQNRATPAIGAGLALAMQFYCGYLPTAIYYLGALTLYYLLVPQLLTLPSATEVPQAVKFPQTARFYLSQFLYQFLYASKYLALTLAVGLGLAAVIYWPIFELLSYSNRKIVPTEIGFIWLPPWHLITLILPRFFGTAFDPTIARRFLAVGISQDRSFYLGLTSLFFLCLPLISRYQQSAPLANSSVNDIATINPPATMNRPVTGNQPFIDPRYYYFLALAMIALLVMMSAPIYVQVTQYLPVLKTIRAVTRISGLYAMASAIMIGYGAQLLLDQSLDQSPALLRRYSRQFQQVILGIIGLLVVLLLIFSSFRSYLPTSNGGRLRQVTSNLLLTASEQFTVSRVDLILVIVGLLLLVMLANLFYRQYLSSKQLFYSLFLLLVVELIGQSAQYNQTFPAQQTFPSTKTTQFLQAQLGNYRVVVAPAEFTGKADEREEGENKGIVAPPNTLLPYKIATITGKDQLFPRWYREFTALAEPQNYLSHIVFKQWHSPLYDLMGVKYLLTREVNTPPPGLPYTLRHQAEHVKIYENLAVQPRAFFAAAVQTVDTPTATLAALRNPQFDWRKQVIVTPLQPLTNWQPSTSADTVTLTSYQHNQVAMQTNTSGPRLLVLTDTFYPGWEATVDGQVTPILRANHSLRAVIVPAGQHQVRFQFRPRSFRYGLMISLITLILSLAMLCWQRYSFATR